MRFSEDTSASSYHHITGYDVDYVEINRKIIRQSIIVAPENIEEWQVSSFAELKPEDIHHLSTSDPEVIIIGTGEKQQLPAKNILKALVETRIGYEIMNTAAACRTYNILIGEGRNAVAGLILETMVSEKND